MSQLGEIEVRGPQAIDLVSVFRDRVAKFLGKFERKQREEALSLPETLTAPDGVNLAGIKKAIETRGASIRKESAEFIQGSKQRAD